MSRIRTVKPELFRHEELFEAERKSALPLRLIFIGLFTAADEQGRFRWKPRLLKLDILPYDNIEFEQALQALEQFGFIKRYEHGNETYGYIPTWVKHQRINQRESRSQLPSPFIHPVASVNHDLLTDVDLPADMHVHAPAKTVHAHGERKGKGKWKGNRTEWKRKGRTKLLRSRSLRLMPWSWFLNIGNASWITPKPCWISSDGAIFVLLWKMATALRIYAWRLKAVVSTPHNRGHNERGERYDGLHLILRSADQIDRFIRNAQHPPKLLNKADQRLQSNVDAAQTWLQQGEQKNG